MAKQYDHINARIRKFIEAQKVFFVATATPESRINLSPKGMDTFRVLDEKRAIWLNLTGSGNESAAHVRENGRMTIMFCSFEKKPLILRLYGRATVCHPRDADWPALSALFPEHSGARQIFTLKLDMVQTSCGYAVPYLDFRADRPMLANWAAARGEEGLRTYWAEKNTCSLDGKDTGIFED